MPEHSSFCHVTERNPACSLHFSLAVKFTWRGSTELWVSCLLVNFVSHPSMNISLSDEGASLGGLTGDSPVFSINTSPAPGEQHPGRWVILASGLLSSVLWHLSLHSNTKNLDQVQNQLQSSSSLPQCWVNFVKIFPYPELLCGVCCD